MSYCILFYYSGINYHKLWYTISGFQLPLAFNTVSFRSNKISVWRHTCSTVEPFYSNKPGRKSKFKWPDTFLIESSGRRETPESIAEAKARDARRQFAALAKQVANTGGADGEQDILGPEETHHIGESDTGSDQDLSDAEEVEDSLVDVSGKM